MNYFDFLNIKNKSITVFGADENSDFVKALKGVVSSVTIPDTFDGKLHLHTEAKIEEYKKNGLIIGIVDVNIMEKKISDSIIGIEEFCQINNLFADELIFPLALARVIENREKYDILYINNVDGEGKRYIAREIAKRLRNGMLIKLINTDSNYVETLVK